MDAKKYQPTALERVSGHPTTAAAATSAAVASGGMLAALLPILTASLASGRHARRIELFINDVSDILEQHAETLEHLTDSQYELINSAVMSALHTLDLNKIKYLRIAVESVLDMDINPVNSAYIARVIRDISAEEAEFLLRTSEHQQMAYGADNQTPEIFMVDPDSADAIALDGLVSLGVIRVQAGFGGGIFVKTTSAETICKLLG